MAEVTWRAEYAEFAKQEDYLYCETNKEALNSQALKYEFLSALKEEFWEKNWKKYYKSIFLVYDFNSINKELRDEIKENILNNKEFLEKLEDLLDSKILWTNVQTYSEVINFKTLKILLTNEFVKSDISDVLSDNKLKAILDNYSFWISIEEWITAENDEIELLTDLEKYLVFKIHDFDYYIVNKETKKTELISNVDTFKEYNNILFINYIDSGKSKSFVISKWWNSFIVDDYAINAPFNWKIINLLEKWYFLAKTDWKYYLYNMNLEKTCDIGSNKWFLVWYSYGLELNVDNSNDLKGNDIILVDDRNEEWISEYIIIKEDWSLEHWIEKKIL